MDPVYPYQIRSTDLEAQYVIFPKTDGLLIGIAPDVWATCMKTFSKISLDNSTGLHLPTSKNSSWGFNESLTPVNRDLFDTYEDLESWKWWQCSAPRCVEGDLQEALIDFQSISKTLSFLCLNMLWMANDPDGWSIFSKRKQLIIVDSLSSSGKYPHGGALSIELSQALCVGLFTDDHVEITKNTLVNQLCRMHHWIHNDGSSYASSYLERFSGDYDCMRFMAVLDPTGESFIMHVPGDCACLGGRSDNDEKGIELQSHNVDNLHQQFLHLYGIAVLWKLAYDLKLDVRDSN